MIAAKEITKVALPKLECGLDGLNRNTLLRLIERKYSKSKKCLYLRLLKDDGVTSLTKTDK